MRRVVLFSLLLSACANAPASPCDGTSCDRSQFAGGKADGVDPCAEYGWYDDADGYCDDVGTYCAQPDPDCGPDPDACGDTDRSRGMEWPGDPQVGCVGADTGGGSRDYEVLFTEPFCDTCTARDKEVLLDRSPIIARVIELIDGAETSVDVAQFTFSRRNIEDALVAAHERGVTVRVAMDGGQDRDGSLSRRLRDRGVDVRFVSGRPVNDEWSGLQHAKFMIVDGTTVLTGSNNWSSTGTSINEENTIVITAAADDPYVSGFTCHFAAIWEGDHEAAGACSTDDVTFAPGGAPRRMIRDAIREAQTSVDVLMHHFTFDDLVDELTDAQRRGVQVRVILNEADRGEHSGRRWQELVAAGAEIRFKRNNADAYQLMHHKLAIVDGELLLNGSGNWSGSGFFNNFENYVAYREDEVVEPFNAMFARLWRWSLTANSLDTGATPAEQLYTERSAYFGSLHGHVEARHDGELVDDGHRALKHDDGTEVPVEYGESMAEASRYAFEYARDRGGLDFVAISPHTSDEVSQQDPNQAHMTQPAYEALMASAAEVTEESDGAFVALPGMEWSSNSTGNHVNLLGSTAVPGLERGAFDQLYNDFLPSQTEAGARPIVMMNHPRTFRQNPDTLSGTYDQEFGILLTEIENNSQRNKKFNDYGLDDFMPLAGVRQRWIDGEVMPERSVVYETLGNLWAASAPYARLMEVTLNRGNELGDEEPYNPSITVDEDGTEARRTKVHEDWDYYLSHGFRLAPVASHDNHYANWGTGHTSRTAVLASSLSASSLEDALYARSVYASEDEDLDLRFYVDDRVAMGEEMETTERALEATVALEDPDYSGPYEIRVYQGALDGEAPTVVQTQTVPEGWTRIPLTLSDGGQYVYVEVLEVDANRMAWSAPIWITAL